MEFFFDVLQLTRWYSTPLSLAVWPKHSQYRNGDFQPSISKACFHTEETVLNPKHKCKKGGLCVPLWVVCWEGSFCFQDLMVCVAISRTSIIIILQQYQTEWVRWYVKWSGHLLVCFGVLFRMFCVHTEEQSQPDTNFRSASSSICAHEYNCPKFYQLVGQTCLIEQQHVLLAKVGRQREETKISDLIFGGSSVNAPHWSIKCLCLTKLYHPFWCTQYLYSTFTNG